MDARVKVRLVV